MSYDGARIIITGGANGIGLALAKKLAAAGGRIVFCDVNAEAVERAEAALPGAKGLVCDVSDAEALEEFFAEAFDHLGGVDLGWNNAGVMQAPAPLPDLDWAEYQRVLTVNLHAVFRGSQILVKQMIRQGTPARIINTGSENSLFHTVANGGAYVASKVAVRALTESLRDETPDFIDVKLLCPGFVNTSLGPEALFQYGMDVDRFAEIAFPLLNSDQFYLVSHGYNAVRLKDLTEDILAQIEAGAAPAEETKRFDVGVLSRGGA